MKFCPFLVAGQSLGAPQQQTGAQSPAPGSAFATPDVDAILHDTSVTPGASGAGDDASIIRFRSSPRSGPGAPNLPVRVPGLGSLECLGEPCRFFHDGGCRFDALFESCDRGALPAGLVVGTIVDGPGEAGGEPGTTAGPGGDPHGRAARSVLEEVWSLQRESLRVAMSGFQRIASDHASLQSGLVAQVEAQVGRLETDVGKMETRVGAAVKQVVDVAGQVGKVHSQVSDAVTHLVQVSASVGQLGTRISDVDSHVAELRPQIDSVTSRVGDFGSSIVKIEAQMEGVASRFEHVEGQLGGVAGNFGRVEAEVTKFGSQLTSVAAAVVTVESQVKRVEGQMSNLQSSLAVVASEIQDLQARFGSQPRSDKAHPGDPELLEMFGRHFEALTREVHQLETTMRSSVGDSLRGVAKETQTAAQQAIAASESGLRAVIEDLQAALRGAVQESKETVRSSVGESQAQLGSLLARSSAETRAQLERGLGKMLEEMKAVRDTRLQMQGLLDGLSRETREVGALARRVESSQVLTHELLDEQRQVQAKIDDRERREQARQLNNAGVLSYHQAAYDTSVERFRQATELDPTLAEAYNNLGLSYTEMGRDEEATIAFQRALEIDPSSTHVYNNLGYLCYRRGDLDHAVEMYQRAIQRGGDSSSAYSNLANAYYRLKKLDQAVAAWRRALEIDPANAKAAAALERLGIEPHRGPRRT